MGEYYPLSEWLVCPECKEDDPEYKYSADDGTTVYACENCGARVEIH